MSAEDLSMITEWVYTQVQSQIKARIEELADKDLVLEQIREGALPFNAPSKPLLTMYGLISHINHASNIAINGNEILIEITPMSMG